MRWLLDISGSLANLVALDAPVDELETSPSPIMESGRAIRERILMRRNPGKLVDEAVWFARADRVIDAVMPAGRVIGR